MLQPLVQVRGGSRLERLFPVAISFLGGAKVICPSRTYVLRISEGLDVSGGERSTIDRKNVPSINSIGLASSRMRYGNGKDDGTGTPALSHTSHGDAKTREGRTREYTGAMGEALERDKVKLYRMVFQSPRTRSLQAIRERMERMEKAYPPSMHLFNILLKSMIWLNDREGIRAILEKIRQAGLAFNLITFNLMIGYYRDQECAREAERLLWVMYKAGIKPSVYTFTTLISAFSRSDLRKCQEYWEQARTLGPDIYAYNAIIGAYAQHGDLSMADRLVEELQAVGLIANFVTYKILLEGLTKAMRLEDAMRLYERLLSDCNELRMGDYSEVARCFWRAGGRSEALRIYKDMERIFGHMDYHGIINSLNVALLQRDEGEAEKIFDRYIPSHAKKYEYALKRLIHMVEEDGTGERPALVQRMREVLDRIEPDKGNGEDGHGHGEGEGEGKDEFKIDAAAK